MRIILMAAAAAGALGLATSASALTPVRACDTADITPTAQACSGYFAGNLLGGSAEKLNDQKTGLAAIGLDWDTANWGTVVKDNNGNALGELGLLSKLTWIGIHYGAGRDGPGFGIRGGVTAFYRFDAGASLETFGINQGAISSVALYETGEPTEVVPEPATWAMMIAGFGLVGASMRRRRSMARVSA